MLTYVVVNLHTRQMTPLVSCTKNSNTIFAVDLSKTICIGKTTRYYYALPYSTVIQGKSYSFLSVNLMAEYK